MSILVYIFDEQLLVEGVQLYVEKQINHMGTLQL